MKRPMRYYYLKLVRQSGTPDYIAGGMALGIFISFTLPPFTQMIAAFILAFLLGLNRITALLGCWISNPITYPFILTAQFFVGMIITGTQMPATAPDTYEAVWMHLTNLRTGWPYVRAFLVGAVATGILAAIAGYFLTRIAVKGFRERRKFLFIKRRKLWHRKPPKDAAQEPSESDSDSPSDEHLLQ